MSNLPLDRDETLVPSSKVPSALLDNLQDCVKARKHGRIVLNFSSMNGEGSYLAKGTAHGLAAVELNNGSGIFYVFLEGLAVGTVVEEAVLDHYGNGATDVTARIGKVSKALPLGATLTGASLLITNAPASWQSTTLTVTDPPTNGRVAADEVYYIEWDATNGPDFEVGNIAITCYKD